MQVREIVCLADSYSAGGTSYSSGHVLLHSINWLAKHKTLNDFTVFLRKKRSNIFAANN